MSKLLLLFLLLVGPAWAHDPAGRWGSSSGSTIELWANMEQVVVTVIGQDGSRNRYNGYWTQFSDRFQYQAQGVLYTASFQDPNTIVVTAAGQPTRTWSRGGAPARPPRGGGSGYNPTGLYLSSSGSSVQVTARGAQIFVTFVTAQGRRLQGSGVWLSSNRFDYTVPGVAGRAICTIDTANPARILVQSPSGTTVWTRQ